VDVLGSRILVRPSDLDRSLRFYRDVLGLAVYREFGPPDHPRTVFFLGQGLLEVSGQAAGPAGRSVMIWIQVRDVRRDHAGWPRPEYRSGHPGIGGAVILRRARAMLSPNAPMAWGGPGLRGGAGGNRSAAQHRRPPWRTGFFARPRAILVVPACQEASSEGRGVPGRRHRWFARR
jgi:catechol 2,3-dioxygenase-like lactoylglutathione lyase family enzyme